MGQFVAGAVYQGSSQACIVDLVPPVFAGIVSLVANPNGSLTASWLAGTDVLSPPVTYKIFIQPASEPSADLFLDSNEHGGTHHLSHALYTDADEVPLLADTLYRVGVRASDAVGNEDSNGASLTATSAGVLDDTLAGIAQDLLETATLLRDVGVHPVEGSVDNPGAISGKVEGE